jgi:cation-transporting ATPase E
VISEFERYTGLTYGSDTDFTAAAATIGAQTGLSTFFCLASFLLILFLAPPNRFFAAWTEPVGDRRPTYLVGGLIVAFGTVLFVPALYTYFGLAGPSRPLFVIVGVMLALWFAALSLVYRLRLLNRVLGLDGLRA